MPKGIPKSQTSGAEEVRTAGKKPKAGRKPGDFQRIVSGEQRLVPVKAQIAEQSRLELTQRLIDKIVAINLTPLEIILTTMKLHYDQAQKALGSHLSADDPDVKEQHMQRAKREFALSSHFAEKVAPYLHPRLATTVIKGDDRNPISIVSNLRSLSDEELMVAQKLVERTVIEDEAQRQYDDAESEKSSQVH